MRRSTILAMVVLAAVGVGVVTAPGCNRTAASIEERREPAPGSPDQAGGLASEDTPAEPAGKGIAAMQRASQEGKYLFAFFRKDESDQTAAMRRLLEEVMEEVANRADSVEVNVTAPSERAIVEKFDLGRAPLPLILAVAPNGAITGGFPTKAERQELLDAFASSCMEKCMKALQENKLVFLCIQNSSTKANGDALQGVHDFQVDGRFARATQIVMLDPTDTAEAEFLKDLQVDPKTQEAVTVFLAPPGVPIAAYKGATNKDELVATLTKASSACGPGGCGPGGCAPKQ